MFMQIHSNNVLAPIESIEQSVKYSSKISHAHAYTTVYTMMLIHAAATENCSHLHEARRGSKGLRTQNSLEWEVDGLDTSQSK